PAAAKAIPSINGVICNKRLAAKTFDKAKPWSKGKLAAQKQAKATHPISARRDEAVEHCNQVIGFAFRSWRRFLSQRSTPTRGCNPMFHHFSRSVFTGSSRQLRRVAQTVKTTEPATSNIATPRKATASQRS